jgi:hypothetical protein
MSTYTPDPAKLRDKIAEDIPRSLIDSPAVGVGTARRLKLADAMLAAVESAGYVITTPDRLLPADARPRTEWCWLHVHGKRSITARRTMNRAEVERRTAIFRRANPGDDISVTTRTVTTYGDGSVLLGPWLPVPAAETHPVEG